MRTTVNLSYLILKVQVQLRKRLCTSVTCIALTTKHTNQILISQYTVCKYTNLYYTYFNCYCKCTLEWLLIQYPFLI